MKKVIGIPSYGPNLSDNISDHFGHCNYFVGIKINEDKSFEKLFDIKNNGHSGCMEPVIEMRDNEVTDMIVGGIGGRPYLGFLQFGIPLSQGVAGRSIKENIEFYIKGKLIELTGSSCSSQSNH
ncbi:MAG: NifB/NifX family molybdenum-iron cluster-binding protein [Promethearchaeota archaeon]